MRIQRVPFGRGGRRGLPLLVLALLAVGLLPLGCAGGATEKQDGGAEPRREDPEFQEISAEKRKALGEWLQALQQPKIELIADHLVLRISQEAIDRLVIRESRQLYAMQREETENATVRRYVNRRGSLSQPLEFRIGAARFQVLGTAELHFVRHKDAVLEIELRGKVEGFRGGEPFKASRLSFEEGKWTTEAANAESRDD